MKIGILQTGKTPPELAGRFGDYPAMFKTLLSQAGPGTRCHEEEGKHHFDVIDGLRIAGSELTRTLVGG